MVKKVVAKKSTRNNPTLHGLLIARTMSGTVVRTLLFIVLSGALILAATLNIDEGHVGAVAMLLLMSAIYLLFDVLYVLMANVRPLHPRVDRVVLPGALVIALLAVYAPLVLVTGTAINVVNIWLMGGVVLLCILGVRLGLLIASSNR